MRRSDDVGLAALWHLRLKNHVKKLINYSHVRSWWLDRCQGIYVENDFDLITQMLYNFCLHLYFRTWTNDPYICVTQCRCVVRTVRFLHQFSWFEQIRSCWSPKTLTSSDPNHALPNSTSGSYTPSVFSISHFFYIVYTSNLGFRDTNWFTKKGDVSRIQKMQPASCQFQRAHTPHTHKVLLLTDISAISTLHLILAHSVWCVI